MCGGSSSSWFTDELLKRILWGLNSVTSAVVPALAEEKFISNQAVASAVTVNSVVSHVRSPGSFVSTDHGDVVGHEVVFENAVASSVADNLVFS
jgi:hypothetical protein